MSMLDSPENNLIDEKNVGFTNVVLKWGLISGAASIGMQLLTQILGLKSGMDAIGVLLGLISLAIPITILVLALREHRDKQLSGFMSFGRGFLVALLVMVVSTLLTSIFQYIYFNFINPSALDGQLELVKKSLEKWITDEDKLDEMVEGSRTTMKSPLSIVQATATVAIFGSIVALIFAAIFQRKRPMFN
jgi:membrane associated rhomboid family serine protease